MTNISLARQRNY